MPGDKCFELGCGGCDECVDYDYDEAADLSENSSVVVRRPMPGDGGKSEVQRMWWEYWAEQNNRPQKS